jgi:hypothetical protein
MDSKQQNEIKKLAKIIYKLALREKYVNKLNKKLLLLDSIDNNLISHLHKEFPLYGGGAVFEATDHVKEIKIGSHTINQGDIIAALMQVHALYETNDINGEPIKPLIKNIYNPLITELSLSEDDTKRVIEELKNRQISYNGNIINHEYSTKLPIVSATDLNDIDPTNDSTIIDTLLTNKKKLHTNMKTLGYAISTLYQYVERLVDGTDPLTGIAPPGIAPPDREPLIKALKETINTLGNDSGELAEAVAEIINRILPQTS